MKWPALPLGFGIAGAALCSQSVAGAVMSEEKGRASAPREASPESASVQDAPEPRSDTSALEKLAVSRGFAYFPSAPRAGAFRLALGGSYDALDPQVMYGYELRVPQFSLDVREGLGRGWSLRGHLNTMLVTNELLVGASFARQVERWSFEASLSVGLYAGMLNTFGFDALLLAPEYRPEVSIGFALGKVALSLRGSLLLMGPERVRVGEIWGGLDNASLFAGHSEMLFVENPLPDGSVWYFGFGLMTTRAYYALWLLFPDSPALFTYPRVAGGYEF
jgi:hypothetical protein